MKKLFRYCVELKLLLYLCTEKKEQDMEMYRVLVYGWDVTDYPMCYEDALEIAMEYEADGYEADIVEVW